MAWVYMLKGSKGRYYIGATEALETRVARHNTGMVHSSKRLVVRQIEVYGPPGLLLQLIASREFSEMEEARKIETMLKRWKNPTKTKEFLTAG